MGVVHKVWLASDEAWRSSVNTTQLCDIIGSTTVAFETTIPESERDEKANEHFTRLREPLGLSAPTEISWAYCYFRQVAVDSHRAYAMRDEVIDLLEGWPTTVGERAIRPLNDLPTLQDMTEVLGNQADAYGLLALGQTLRFWEINTPETYGYTAGTPSADTAASKGGYVRTNGYTPTNSHVG